MSASIINSGKELASVFSSTLVDFILYNKIPFSPQKYEIVKGESDALVLVPLKIIAVLVAIFGTVAMVFEIRHFTELSFQIYFIRVGSVLISLLILTLSVKKRRIKHPNILVHVLLFSIIISSALMIKIIPSTLLVNSSIVGLMIFSSALFLSWEVKNQIIVAIYYNLVFAATILLSENAIYFLPNIYESILFVLFLSIVSIVACAINFRMRLAIAESNFEVKLSEDRFKSIIDNSAEGIFQCSPDGELLTANRAFANILGFKNGEDLINTNINDFYADEEEKNNLMKELRRYHEVRDYRVKMRKTDDAIVYVRLNNRLISDESGSEYFEGNIYDITDQVYAEEKRIKAENELKLEKDKSEKLAQEAVKLNDAKSKFLASMSHEIRTPINGILGFLTLIEEGSFTSQTELKQYSSSAKQSAESLLEVINSVLDLSKIEAGKTELEQNAFDFRSVLNQSISVVSSLADDNGIKIIKDVPEDIDTLYIGDKTKLRQVFINLLANSVKFTSDGKINIRIRSEKLNAEQVRLKAVISDTGIGIPVDKIDALFKPFSQIDGSENGETRGSGLGLVICREYVSLMGGEISVKSTEGKGTVFEFDVVLKKQISEELQQLIVDSLVAEETKSAEETEPSQNNNGSFDRKDFNILLAEDNLINQKVSLKILSSAGYKTTAVNNGAEAVEEIKNNNYDLVLMDIQMPEVDGFSATSQIRSLDDDKNKIPIVALTAHALMGDKEKCIKAGMNDYISKPIIAKDLIDKIDQLLNGNNTKQNPKQAEKIENDSVFDFDRLNKVSMGDDAFENDLLTSYLSDVESKLEKLVEFADEKKLKQIIDLAHTVKGASYSVGAQKIGDEAYAIEISGRSNDLENARERLSNLRVAISETKLMIENYLK